MEKTPESTYLIVLSISLEQSLFPNQERKQKKSMETMGQERVLDKNKPGGTCGIGVIFLRI
jgi:hypothetical protein